MDTFYWGCRKVVLKAWKECVFLISTAMVPCKEMQTREEGRQCLRALLRWEEFDDVRDLRRSIELDSLYSSIVFAVEKGLSWPAVVEAGKLAEELLTETKGGFRIMGYLEEGLGGFEGGGVVDEGESRGTVNRIRGRGCLLDSGVQMGVGEGNEGSCSLRQSGVVKG
ncbi:protein FAM115C [Platysternon megacephalum]|uniref:Protein FAM115C n=1 Tax=Platysternon megacephalum TaxID=55544 RepID=A0A4D9DRF2_9SAUR|nr:protein FAM115C [Platysternon megacephalum]